MYNVGQLVFDRKVRQRAVIAHVEDVPETADLFGDRVPGYRRCTLAYLHGDLRTGQWHNDRRIEDLEPLVVAEAEAIAAAVFGEGFPED